MTCKNDLSSWFDRALIKNLRPDIVVRPGHFGMQGEISDHVRLLRNGFLIAEYRNGPLEEQDGFFVQSQKMKSSSGEKTCLYFRIKGEYLHPHPIIECKSYGACMFDLTNIKPVDFFRHLAVHVLLENTQKSYVSEPA